MMWLKKPRRGVSKETDLKDKKKFSKFYTVGKKEMNIV